MSSVGGEVERVGVKRHGSGVDQNRLRDGFEWAKRFVRFERGGGGGRYGRYGRQRHVPKRRRAHARARGRHHRARHHAAAVLGARARIVQQRRWLQGRVEPKRVKPHATRYGYSLAKSASVCTTPSARHRIIFIPLGCRLRCQPRLLSSRRFGGPLDTAQQPKSAVRWFRNHPLSRPRPVHSRAST